MNQAGVCSEDLLVRPRVSITTVSYGLRCSVEASNYKSKLTLKQ